MVTTLYPELSLPPLAFYFSLLVTVYLISTIPATKGLNERTYRVCMPRNGGFKRQKHRRCEGKPPSRCYCNLIFKDRCMIEHKTQKMSKNLGSEVEHGGNIYRLAEELKIQERKVIDFSASVNPLGVSKKIKAELRKHLKYLHNYPDTDTRRLRKRLAQYYGIDPEIILCGNGSTELIYLITRVLKPRKVLIPAPTFSEYERAVVRAQNREHRTEIKYFILKREDGFNINPDEFIEAMRELHALDSVKMAFLCNPNNPTGRLLKKDDMLKIAGAAQEIKCYLIVDEAFMDFCGG